MHSEINVAWLFCDFSVRFLLVIPYKIIAVCTLSIKTVTHDTFFNFLPCNGYMRMPSSFKYRLCRANHMFLLRVSIHCYSGIVRLTACFLFRFGMHENMAYYENCASRERNRGLFIADRVSQLFSFESLVRVAVS